jgi:hypothetical protein
MLTAMMTQSAPNMFGYGGGMSSPGAHYVHGYRRRDGTYVAPHWQTNPDGNVWNNWSTYGNVNPFTGQMGTRRFPGATLGMPMMGGAPMIMGPMGMMPATGW